MLMIPLLPLVQCQHAIDLREYETAATAYAEKNFNHDRWERFAQYLCSHCRNHDYHNLQIAQLTWMDVMRMLRNIVAHEQDVYWSGIVECVQQVVTYMQSRQYFREFLSILQYHTLRQ